MVEMFMYNYIDFPHQCFPPPISITLTDDVSRQSPWSNRDIPILLQANVTLLKLLTAWRKTLWEQNMLNTILPTNPIMSIQMGLPLLSIISRLERIFPMLTNEQAAIWLRQMGMSHLANWSRWRRSLSNQQDPTPWSMAMREQNPKDLEIQVYKRMGNRAPPLSAGQLGSLNSEQTFS